jgi:hypothetical protein
MKTISILDLDLTFSCLDVKKRRVISGNAHVTVLIFIIQSFQLFFYGELTRKSEACQVGVTTDLVASFLNIELDRS